MRKKCRYCGAIILEGVYCCETYARKAKHAKELTTLYNRVRHPDFTQLKRLNNFAKAKGHSCIFTGEINES